MHDVCGGGAGAGQGAGWGFGQKETGTMVGPGRARIKFLSRAVAFGEPWTAARRDDSVCFMKKIQVCKVTCGDWGLSVPGSVTFL